MAAQTHDSSGPNSDDSNLDIGTPISSYIGIGIIAAIVLAMILLQTMSSTSAL